MRSAARGGRAGSRGAAAGGGTVVLVDSAPELLHAATAHVRRVGGARVEVQAVRADADDDTLLDLVPRADLVFASFGRAPPTRPTAWT
ncbi:MAG: hypothetical protein ACRDTF_15690 [Pseudonocardiaceae bacterium]